VCTPHLRSLRTGADILITSGGVSMGDLDLIKPLLERSGKVHFGKVLMKPGKPLTFATVELQAGRQLLVFGLLGGGAAGGACCGGA
jgi:gephyrin